MLVMLLALTAQYNIMVLCSYYFCFEVAGMQLLLACHGEW